MDHQIFRIPLLGWFFRLAKAIPIAPQKDGPGLYEQAFARARRVLDAGDLLCIFPEGAITRDGELAEFKGGVMKLLETHPVPVVPLALQNLWGSFFSRIEGEAMTRPFRRGLFSPRGAGRGRRGAGGAGLAGRLARARRPPARVLTGGAAQPVVKPGGDSPSGAGPWCSSRSYSEMTWAPKRSRPAAISRLSRTTIAVVSEP